MAQSWEDRKENIDLERVGGPNMIQTYMKLKTLKDLIKIKKLILKIMHTIK